MANTLNYIKDFAALPFIMYFDNLVSGYLHFLERAVKNAELLKLLNAKLRSWCTIVTTLLVMLTLTKYNH